MSSATTTTITLLLVAILATCFTPLLTSAHICMWAPHQRGPMQINDPGDHSCYHKQNATAPCGPMGVAGPIAQYFNAGQDFVVQFQQNLNHFYGGKPGQLLAQIAFVPNPQDSDFTFMFGQAIPDFNAMDEINVANFTIYGQIPVQTTAAGVLRLTYQSNNPGEDDQTTNFVQCSDIAIISHSDEEAEEEVIEQQPSTKSAKPLSASYDCTTPPQWETLFNINGNAYPIANGYGTYSYDAINQFLYASVPSNLGAMYNYQHFANFSSGMEWLVDETNTCGAYGLDPWNDWAYGSTQNEEYLETVNLAGTLVDLFINSLGDFYFGSYSTGESTCLPVLKTRFSTQEMTLYYNTTLGIANPSIFQAPAKCQLTKAYQVQQTGSAEEIAEFVKTLPRSTSPKTKHHHVAAAIHQAIGGGHKKKHSIVSPVASMIHPKKHSTTTHTKSPQPKPTSKISQKKHHKHNSH